MEKVLMKGNEALGEAAIRSGCRHFFGYPITPQTELSAYLAKKMPKIGGTFLQAESEIAAINMVLGAASTGVRAMTSSSSPGISLKSEGVSYIAGSDLPCVIINVQRGGPGLGGIQPSQADYWQATKALGHGDFQLLVFAPSTVQEMAELVCDAFNLAETYRMPAMILADGALGQMMEPVSFDSLPKPLPIEKPWAATGTQMKREHNVINSLYLVPDQLERTILERYARYEIIKEKEPGLTSRIVKSVVKEARAKGIKAGLIRPITLWPFPDKALKAAAGTAKQFLVAEMSMGQMVDDVRLAIECARPVSFIGRTGGMIPQPQDIMKKIEELVGGDK